MTSTLLLCAWLTCKLSYPETIGIADRLGTPMFRWPHYHPLVQVTTRKNCHYILC